MDTTDRYFELPGYDRDPNTGRYYRHRNFTCDPIQGTSKGNLVTNPKLSKKAVPVVKNLPDLLARREFGFRQSSAFESNLLKLKTRKLPVSEELSLGDLFRTIDDIEYLKGGAGSLYGEWRSHIGVQGYTNDHSCIGEIAHQFTKPELEDNPIGIYSVPNRIGVADMCEGFSNPMCVLYVGNHKTSNCGMARLIWRPQVRSDFFEAYRHFIISSPIWCCCSNNFTEKFALGIRDGIAINTASSHLYSRSFSGRVHSVHFNNMGTVIYSGVHNGKLVISDLRATDTVLEKKIDNEGIDETVLLSNENYLIIGGFSGLLCKMDLRMQSVVAEFQGHRKATFKLPFSISEPHNYLCATGTDWITRLWSLDGGEPLNSIQPVREGIPCRSWLVTDGWKCVVYVIQRKRVYLYEV